MQTGFKTRNTYEAGNANWQPEDMTFGGGFCKQWDLAAEDTRHTGKLLQHFRLRQSSSPVTTNTTATAASQNHCSSWVTGKRSRFVTDAECQQFRSWI